jgi:hypothetical protein
MMLALAVGAWALLTQAGDLPKLDRTVTKEPAYAGKPKYCLLAFGPQAKTRVWLVLDGEVIYLDRNANGDLTDDGEGLDARPGQAERRRAKLGVIAPAGRKEVHRILYLDAERIWVEVREGLDQYAPLSYADRPQDAPVFHFDGPLALMANPEDIKQGLRRGGQDNQFRVLLGTRTSAEGVVFVECDQSYPEKRFRVPSSGLPKGIHPVAEIEFPAKEPEGGPVRRRYALDRRC